MELREGIGGCFSAASAILGRAGKEKLLTREGREGRPRRSRREREGEKKDRRGKRRSDLSTVAVGGRAGRCIVLRLCAREIQGGECMLTTFSFRAKLRYRRRVSTRAG